MNVPLEFVDRLAILEYKFSTTGSGDVSKLLEAIRKGENIIGSLDPSRGNSHSQKKDPPPDDQN